MATEKSTDIFWGGRSFDTRWVPLRKKTGVGGGSPPEKTNNNNNKSKKQFGLMPAEVSASARSRPRSSTPTSRLPARRLLLGLGQNGTTRGPQVLVHVSIYWGSIFPYMGVPFTRVPIGVPFFFYPHPVVERATMKGRKDFLGNNGPTPSSQGCTKNTPLLPSEAV